MTFLSLEALQFPKKIRFPLRRLLCPVRHVAQSNICLKKNHDILKYLDMCNVPTEFSATAADSEKLAARIEFRKPERKGAKDHSSSAKLE